MSRSGGEPQHDLRRCDGRDILGAEVTDLTVTLGDHGRIKPGREIIGCRHGAYRVTYENVKYKSPNGRL